MTPRKKLRRWVDLTDDADRVARPEYVEDLSEIDAHFDEVQQKHHPGSLDVTADYGFLFEPIDD